MTSNAITVYTAIFGNYEGLVEQPAAVASDAKFVCFTDNADLVSTTWDIRVVEPALPYDSVRSARRVKILGFRELESDVSIWIDNRVILKVSPESLVQQFLSDNDIAIPSHDHRDSVHSEYREVMAAGLDSRQRVREQLQMMQRFAPRVLDETPLWTAIILRRRAGAVVFAMEKWWDQVAMFSRRDQLSCNFAMSTSKTRLRVIDIPNTESHLHQWLRADQLPKRNDVLYSQGSRYTFLQHLVDTLAGNSLIVKARNRMQRASWAIAANVKHKRD